MLGIPDCSAVKEEHRLDERREPDQVLDTGGRG